MLHKKTLENPEVQREIGVFFLNINYYGYSLHRDLSTSSLFPAQNTWKIAVTESGLIISCLPADSDWHRDAALLWKTILKAAFTGTRDVMQFYF